MSQYDIFISHDSRDQEVASHLKEFLEGIFIQSEIYVSSHNIQGGDPWFENITSALKACKVIISLISKNSIDNNWVYFETGAGVTESKSIPLIGDKLDFKDLTKYPVSSIQSRKFDEHGVYQLITDIAKLIKASRPPKKENIMGIAELVEKCEMSFHKEKAQEFTEKPTSAKKNREQIEVDEDDENAWSRELQESLDAKIEKTQIHLKNYWIKLVNTKYNIQKATLNGIHKFNIDQLHDYLLSVGITSQSDNYSDFNESENIQRMPSKRDKQEHALTLLIGILERIKRTLL